MIFGLSYTAHSQSDVRFSGKDNVDLPEMFKSFIIDEMSLDLQGDFPQFSAIIKSTDLIHYFYKLLEM